MNEIMCSGGWWVCFQYYLYKIKKVLENGSNCPFSCLDFYTSTSTNGVSFLVPLQNNSILG